MNMGMAAGNVYTLLRVVFEGIGFIAMVKIIKTFADLSFIWKEAGRAPLWKEALEGLTLMVLRCLMKLTPLNRALRFIAILSIVALLCLYSWVDCSYWKSLAAQLLANEEIQSGGFLSQLVGLKMSTPINAKMLSIIPLIDSAITRLSPPILGFFCAYAARRRLVELTGSQDPEVKRLSAAIENLNGYASAITEHHEIHAHLQISETGVKKKKKRPKSL